MSFNQTNEPWIGKIPPEWGLPAIKRIVSTKITDGPHETPELSDEGVQFISAEAIKNNRIDFSLRRGFISRELHEQYSRKCKPQRSDLFVIKSGATTGNVAYVDVDFEFSIWSPLALIRCDKRIAHYKFIYYVLLSDVFRKQVELSWSFGTQQNIGMGVIERLKVPIPPLPEQLRIASFLDTSCAAIDAAINAKGRQLKTLNALRSSIINRAVPRIQADDSDVPDTSGVWVHPEKAKTFGLEFFERFCEVFLSLERLLPAPHSSTALGGHIAPQRPSSRPMMPAPRSAQVTLASSRTVNLWCVGPYRDLWLFRPSSPIAPFLQYVWRACAIDHWPASASASASASIP